MGVVENPALIGVTDSKMTFACTIRLLESLPWSSIYTAPDYKTAAFEWKIKTQKKDENPVLTGRIR